MLFSDCPATSKRVLLPKSDLTDEAKDYTKSISV